MSEPDAGQNNDEKVRHNTVTVILCTYNRCQSLSKALQSVAASEMPTSAVWEVLVVDNNSHDQTREVVEDFSRRYPGRFRYLFEPKPGKSHALNAGIREAHGEILVFIDDDVTVDKNWLSNLTAPGWQCVRRHWGTHTSARILFTSAVVAARWTQQYGGYSGPIRFGCRAC